MYQVWWKSTQGFLRFRVNEVKIAYLDQVHWVTSIVVLEAGVGQVFPQHQHRPQHHNWNHAGVVVDLENYDVLPVVGVVAGVKYRLLIRISRSVLAICM